MDIDKKCVDVTNERLRSVHEGSERRHLTPTEMAALGITYGAVVEGPAPVEDDEALLGDSLVVEVD